MAVALLLLSLLLFFPIIFYGVCFCAKVLRKFIFAIVLLRLVRLWFVFTMMMANAIGAFYVISSAFAERKYLRL